MIENSGDCWFYAIGFALSLLTAGGGLERLLSPFRGGRPFNRDAVRLLRFNAAFVALVCLFALLQFVVFRLRHP